MTPLGRARVAIAALAVVLASIVVASCSAGSSTASDRPRRSTRVLPIPETSTTRPPPVPSVSPPSTDPPTTTTAQPSVALPDGVDGVVTSITDGDTIRVRVASGIDERVRLIGIDTPETRDPRSPVECFGREASAQMAALVPVGTRVRLEPDVESRDRYGRLLAYVWRADDARLVNEALVAGGWAAPYRYPPNVKYADHFSALGAQAREQGLGLWGACGGADTQATVAVPPPLPFAAPEPQPEAGCDANYAGACVPLSDIDLDCADVGARRFQVVGADPHGFDGDGDGLACE